VGCLSPKGKVWLRRRRRVLFGLEALAIQGLVIEDYYETVKATSESTLKLLAGNAINFFNFAQGLVAAFSTLKIEWFTSDEDHAA